MRFGFFGTTVPLSTTVEDLGMNLGCSLTMSDHIDSICRSCIFQLLQIRLLKSCLPQESVHVLVKAFVSSRLDYCNSLLYGLGQSLLGKLQRERNAAARLVTGRRKYAHIIPVLRELHWLPIQQRIEYWLSSIVYKCLHGQAPTKLSDVCIPFLLVRSLDPSISRAGELKIPRVRTKMGFRAFNISGPTV